MDVRSVIRKVVNAYLHVGTNGISERGLALGELSAFLEWVEKYPPCDVCGEHQSMHHSSKPPHEQCCGCYVKAGNPPADWHTVCMRTYAEMKKTADSISEPAVR